MTTDRAAIERAAMDAAWAQFTRMPSSNPGDIARSVVSALLPLIDEARTEAVEEWVAARREEGRRLIAEAQAKIRANPNAGGEYVAIEVMHDRIRRAKSEALREAVDTAPFCTDARCTCNSAFFARHLRDRADRISTGGAA